MSASLLLLGACAFPAGPPARTSASTTVPGELTVDLRTHTPWPYRLQRIVVAVDGAVVWRRSGHKPRTNETLARVRLQPQVAHVLAVMVEALAPCGLAGDEDRRLRMRSTTAFAVDAAQPATLAIDVSARSPLAWVEGFDDRLRLAVEQVGTIDPGHAAPPSPTCLAMPSDVARAECMVRELLDGARRARDVVALYCLNARLTAIRALRSRGGRQVEPAVLAEADGARHCTSGGLHYAGETVIEASGCGPMEDWESIAPWPPSRR